MYVLDTDHMSLLERGGPESENLRDRLRNIPPDDVATTIISYEEQARGWLARIAQFTDPEKQVALYDQLKRQLRNYCRVAVIDFDSRSAAELILLQKEKV
jgi:tRNA(fMet)-specific endonuclease VapC